MAAFIARKLVAYGLTLWLASVLIFGALRLTPGDPAVVLAGQDPSPELIAAITEDLGLDRPLPVQYWRWISDVATGSFGTSYTYRVPIRSLIADRIGNSILLMIAAMSVAIIVGGALGLLGAVTRRGPVRGALAVGTTLGLTIPTFITGIVLILIFAVHLRWLPPGGHVPISSDPVGGLKSLALPTITLALPLSAVIARFTQTSLRQTYQEEYVQTATAKGLTDTRILFRHALPNALPPIITVIGIDIGLLIGGAVIVETIFAWPGLAQLSVQAVLRRDYLVVQTVLLLVIAIFILTQLLTDIAQGMLDPRIRER